MMKTIVSIIACFIITTVHAQRMTVEQYIATYKDAAIAEMKRLGVPASIILAQGILETENGNSDLVKRSNNHFGIKCKSTWTGESVRHTDDAPNECFRKYNSAADSYKDHSDYLYYTPRYASLFKLQSTDYRGWAYGLKAAGYATNPRYPQILINNIEKYNLQQYNEPLSAESQSAVIAQMGIQDTKKEPTIVTAAEPKKELNVFQKLFSGKKNKSNQYFNRLKAVMAFHGTSLLAIATNHDIDLAKLLEFNDLSTDGLVKGDQWIYLEKKHKEGNRDFYTALENESLHEVSQNNGVQLAMLASYNQIPENSFVKKGDVIRLKPGAPIIKPTVSAVLVAPAVKTHQVQPKEGLYTISRRYNVSVEELKEWNNLSSTDLKMGQQLIIAK
jgi:LysM repeat protein